MNWLPRDTILGELTLLETYVFYDGPRLFSAQSLTDQRYLAAWANEGHEADEWLYVAISEARLNMVRSGARTVRSAFLEPEGFTYRVIIPHDDSSPDSAKTVVPSEIETPWVSRRLGLLDSDQGLVGPVCIVERSFELGRWDVAEVAV
ncbi:DUF6575 domain-containing protein [Mycobacterium avium]|uniref:DUF6575 domain-containing protein n=1 Tax=Mycobacterium avium TaxID=1764 RepID=UPI00373FD7C6